MRQLVQSVEHTPKVRILWVRLPPVAILQFLNFELISTNQLYTSPQKSVYTHGYFSYTLENLVCLSIDK